MGGRALKSTYTRRYMRQEFEDIKKEIFDILSKDFKRFDIPRFFESKESFGDIDIILSMDGFNKNMNDYIVDTFNPNEIFHNGNAWSFDYKELQVDFITCSAEDFDSNYHYLAFNDLGNFIGRLAQSIGLKYGQEGLWYNHYSDENTKDKIMVSKDYPKIFEFLGLDYGRWIEGFDTLEEIFEYVRTSYLFNPEMFQLHKLNKINRERNLKRASYMAFLEFLKNKAPHPDYSKSMVELCKEDVINVIRSYFPEANIDLHLAEIAYKHARKNLIKQKFSGGILIEKYGLKGKEIGETIKYFKAQIFNNYGMNFDDFIIKYDQDYILKNFEYYNQLNRFAK
jgi:hypothetical protein